eukprot:4525609-Prymnesium_polylepis.1
MSSVVVLTLPLSATSGAAVALPASMASADPPSWTGCRLLDDSPNTAGGGSLFEQLAPFWDAVRVMRAGAALSPGVLQRRAPRQLPTGDGRARAQPACKNWLTTRRKTSLHVTSGHKRLRLQGNVPTHTCIVADGR